MEKLWNFFSGDLYEPCVKFGVAGLSKFNYFIDDKMSITLCNFSTTERANYPAFKVMINQGIFYFFSCTKKDPKHFICQSIAFLSNIVSLIYKKAFVDLPH